MAQMIKCKLHRLNDQGLDPGKLYERWADWAIVCNPGTRESETGSIGQAHGLAKLNQ